MAMRVVPWMTDDSVEFLAGYLEWLKRVEKREARILEFGMGSSTLFFIDKCKAITGFEHDEEWHTRVVKMLDLLGYDHCKAILAKRPYSDRIEEETRDTRFDLISIDGRDRIKCLREVLRLDLLAENGVLVLDNTERIRTEQGAPYAKMPELLAEDFNVVHFEQMARRDRSGRRARSRWCTTIAWRRRGIQFTTKGKPI